MESLRKALMLGTGYSLYSAVCHAEADEGLGLIELDDNLEDAEKPAELPAGMYTGEVQGVEVRTSAAGNKYFAVRFVIPPEEIPNDMRDGFPDGSSMFYNRIIVPGKGNARALWNLKNFIKSLGLPTNTNQIDPNEWMGQRARLRVVMGKYEGEDRAEIRAVEAAEAEAPAGRGARGAASGRAAAADKGRGRRR